MNTSFKIFYYNAFCDLDGVLCNFDKSFEKLIDLNDINISKSDDNLGNRVFTSFANKYGWTKAWKVIENEGINFWKNLEWTDDGKILWNYLISHFKNVEILTGSPLYKVGKYARIGKDLWCKENLGKDIKVNHVKGILKQTYVKNKTDILIDDAKRNINNWIDAGGIGILHVNTYKTIKILKGLN